jgi:hypothetical protein
MSTYIPTGEGIQRVPAPLTDEVYWSQVMAGDVELHKGGIHGLTSLEDIQNVIPSALGLTFAPTDTEDARVYLTGRLPIPVSRKVYATWVHDTDLPVNLIWWEATTTYEVESVLVRSGISTLNFNTLNHALAVGDTVRVVECGDNFDGIFKVLSVDQDLISYIKGTDTYEASVSSAVFTASTGLGVVTLDDVTGYDLEGYVHLSGIGTPFDGIHNVISVDTTGSTITIAIDYDTDTSYTPTGVSAIFYVVDTALNENEHYLNPFGHASEDIYHYAPLKSREIWGADGYQARITSKALTSNVATVTTSIPLFARPGDTLYVVDLDDTFNGSYIITAVDDETYSLSFALISSDVPLTQVTVSTAIAKTTNQSVPAYYAVYAEMPAGSTDTPTLSSAKVFEVLGEAKIEAINSRVTRSELTNNLAVLTLTNSTNFDIGSEILVKNLGVPYDGLFTIAGNGVTTYTDAEIVSNNAIFGVANVSGFYVGASALVTTQTPTSPFDAIGTQTITSIGTTATVNNKSLTNNVATLQLTGIPSGLFVDAPIVVSGVGSPFDGNFTITSRNNTSNTITYAVTNANVASSSATGNVTATTISVAFTYTNVAQTILDGNIDVPTITYQVTNANVASNTNATGAVTSYLGVEHSELTPTGLTLYNADGSIAVRISSQDVNSISIGDPATGQATISETGDGTFDGVHATSLEIDGDSRLSGAVDVGTDLSVGGNFSVTGSIVGNVDATAYVSTAFLFASNSISSIGNISGKEFKQFSVSANADTTLVGTFDAAKFNQVVAVSGANTNTQAYTNYTGDYLTRLARGRIYSVGWDAAPTGGADYTFTDIYTVFASGKFYIEPGRAYLGVLSTGGIRPTVLPSAAVILELLVSDAAFAVTATSGYRTVSSILINSSATSTNIFAVLASGLHFQFEGTSTAQTNNWTKGLMTAVNGSGTPVPTYWMFRARYVTGSVAATPFAIDAFGGDFQSAEFTIYDMGAALSSHAQLSGTGNAVWAITGTPGGGTTNTNTNVAPPVTTYTAHTASAIIGSTSSAYFDNYGLGDGGTTDPYANQNSLYQGNPGTASGIKKSQVAFGAINSTSLAVPSTAVAYTTGGISTGYIAGTVNAGYKVTKVELYLRNRHSASAAGLTAYWGYSADTSARNSTAPPAPYTAAAQNTKAFTKGQGQYIALGTTQMNYFAGGQIRSILLGMSSAASNTYISAVDTNYGYFDGDLMTDPPKLRVTYTYYTSVTV